jgi:hypothetical protein
MGVGGADLLLFQGVDLRVLEVRSVFLNTVLVFRKQVFAGT